MSTRQAIRKVLNVKNSSITLKGLKSLNNKTVEVIILPLPDETRQGEPKKERINKFRGAGNSGFRDTSHNVDKIIYEE